MVCFALDLVRSWGGAWFQGRCELLSINVLWNQEFSDVLEFGGSASCLWLSVPVLQ